MQISEITAFLENAYGVLNQHYFNGELPKVIITVQSSPKAYGHYTPWESWREQDSGYREINIGAESLDRKIENVVATLVHEMTHFHNDLQGIQDCSRGGTYHNKHFKEQAEAHGLIIDYDSRIGWSLTTPSEGLIAFIEEQGWQGVSLARQGVLGLAGPETDTDKKGFSVSDIQKYEKGDAYIYADKLKILSSILGVRPESILFVDTMEPFSDTAQFKTWRCFVDDIFTYSGRHLGLISYNGYMAFVHSCCGPSWEALSNAGSCSIKGQTTKNQRQQNAIYTCTRKNGLRKSDYNYTRETLVALTYTKDEAMQKIMEDHHIEAIFKREILKHQKVLKTIKRLVELEETQYDISSLEKLNSYFDTISKCLKYAEFRVLNERKGELFESYGDSDEVAYHGEIYEQIIYSEFDAL